MKDNFNLIVAGYGGQGILTATEIIVGASLKEGNDVRETELHGLAQRGGSLDCHVRFGKKIFSPLVSRGEADLIIAFEAVEALRACYYANKETIVILNSKVFRSESKLKEIVAKIEKVAKKAYVIDADKIVRAETGAITGTNIFLLGYALGKGAIPLKKESILQSIKENIRPRFIDENMRLLEKGEKSD